MFGNGQTVMKWLLSNGKLISRNDSKYRIDFDRPSKSKGQFAVKQFLKEHCSGHILFEEIRMPQCLLRVDLLDATIKVAYEYNGVGHEAYNVFYHRNSPLNYLASIKRDDKKRQILERNGYLLIELYPKDLPLLSKEFFRDKFDLIL